MTGGHGQKMTERDSFHPFGNCGGNLFREETSQSVINPQTAFRLCDTDCGGGETLAEREELVLVFRAAGTPPCLCNDFVMTHQHEAVNCVQF